MYRGLPILDVKRERGFSEASYHYSVVEPSSKCMLYKFNWIHCYHFIPILIICYNDNKDGIISLTLFASTSVILVVHIPLSLYDQPQNEREKKKGSSVNFFFSFFSSNNNKRGHTIAAKSLLRVGSCAHPSPSRVRSVHIHHQRHLLIFLHQPELSK